MRQVAAWTRYMEEEKGEDEQQYNTPAVVSITVDITDQHIHLIKTKGEKQSR
jgi:hypothetical protein